MSRFARRCFAFGLVSAMVATACGGSGSKSGSGKTTTTTASAGTGQVSLSPLAVQETSSGSKGLSNPVTLEITDNNTKALRVGFTEDEVAGTGDQWSAAGWNAVTTATLLTGGPLGGKDYTFDITGRIDGPSAGALMTVGVLSLMRGDKIKPDITMTGTINPDGTVGPVGGIPYKVDGAVKAKKTRMLIPAGQRNSENDKGNLVDVVDEGQRKHVAVSETTDVYDAYQQFTGVALPHPPDAAGKVELSEEAYQRIKAKVDDWLAKFSQSAGEFDSLPNLIQQALSSTANDAQSEANRARNLEKQGLEAGAFEHAVEAAGLANAIVKGGRLLQVYLTQGVSKFEAQLQSSTAINGRVQSLFDELKTFTPSTVADAAALIDTYSQAIDALSLSDYATSILKNIRSASNDTEAVTIATEGALYHELAGTLVDSAQDIFAVGRDLGGAKLASTIDPKSVADFFRKAAEANLNAFNTVVLGQLATDNHASLADVQVEFSGKDLDYALANSADNILQGELDQFMGPNTTASAYAKLGGAVSLYSRASGLIAKYYSLDATLDKNLNVTGIGNEKALQASLDLGQSQVERSVSVLEKHKVDPTIVVAGYESAGINRDGNASDKLDALTAYWASFAESRVLAYLGGFPTDGYR